MKFATGVFLGAVGYAAWVLSEPQEGESSDANARLQRLRVHWERAVGQGKQAGDAKRVEMQREFEAIFKK